MSHIEVGSHVKIKRLDCFLASFQKRLKDRVGIVDSIQVFGPPGYRYETIYYWVVWQKRGNRGKEFRERHYLSDLEIAA